MRYLAEAVSNYDGVKGDSSGREVRVCEYWDYLTLNHNTAYGYRHPDESFRDDLMEAAVAIAENDSIGYEMSSERVTSYSAFQAIGWDISRIKDVGVCSIDCSEMMACCVNFAMGYAAMGSDTWTGNIGSRLMSLGFERLDWSVPAEPGDILVVHYEYSNPQTGHTGLFIGNDPKGEIYMSASEIWNHEIAVKYDGEDQKNVPAWNLLSWANSNSYRILAKCDEILDKLDNVQQPKLEGVTVDVDYDRIKEDVREIQKSLRMVAE